MEEQKHCTPLSAQPNILLGTQSCSQLQCPVVGRAPHPTCPSAGMSRDLPQQHISGQQAPPQQHTPVLCDTTAFSIHKQKTVHVLQPANRAELPQESNPHTQRFPQVLQSGQDNAGPQQTRAALPFNTQHQAARPGQG